MTSSMLITLRGNLASRDETTGEHLWCHGPSETGGRVEFLPLKPLKQQFAGDVVSVTNYNSRFNIKLTFQLGG